MYSFTSIYLFVGVFKSLDHLKNWVAEEEARATPGPT